MKNAFLYCGLITTLFSSRLMAAPLAGPGFDPQGSMLADKDGDKDEGDEQKIAPKDLPPAIVAGAAKAYPSGQITGAEKKEDDGKIKYEVDVTVGTQSFELKLAEDGTLLSQSEDIDAKNLPAAVTAGVKSVLPDAVIGEAEKKIKDGKTVYELDVKSGGKNLEVKVAEDGTVLSQKEDDDKD
jgi:uncharacterized membrane protein YkoI